MTATLIELSAPAPTGLPRADATAIAAASAAARKLKVGLGNLTNLGPRMDGPDKRRPSWRPSLAQTNARGDPRWPSMPVPYPSHVHGRKSSVHLRGGRRRCNGDWTRGVNRYLDGVKKPTRMTRETPSGPGGLSGDRALRGLLLGGSLSRSGGLDPLLFGGATAPDVGLP